MYALKMPLSAITGCQVPRGTINIFSISMLKKYGNSFFFQITRDLDGVIGTGFPEIFI